MSIEDGRYKEISDQIKAYLADEGFKEKMLHIESARELLGLREQRTLSQILANQTLSDRAFFNTVLATLALTVYSIGLNADNDLTEATRDAIADRIYEQQDTFLKNPSLTIEDLQLHGISLLLTTQELANPDDQKVYPEDVKETRSNYKFQKSIISLDRFQRAIAFPNELRETTSLKLLK